MKFSRSFRSSRKKSANWGGDLYSFSNIDLYFILSRNNEKSLTRYKPINSSPRKKKTKKGKTNPKLYKKGSSEKPPLLISPKQPISIKNPLLFPTSFHLSFNQDPITTSFLPFLSLSFKNRRKKKETQKAGIERNLEFKFNCEVWKASLGVKG